MGTPGNLHGGHDSFRLRRIRRNLAEEQANARRRQATAKPKNANRTRKENRHEAQAKR